MDKKFICEVNILLSYLRRFNTVQAVKDYFLQYGNTAPSELLENQISLVQNLWNEIYYG